MIYDPGSRSYRRIKHGGADGRFTFLRFPPPTFLPFNLSSFQPTAQGRTTVVLKKAWYNFVTIVNNRTGRVMSCRATDKIDLSIYKL